MKHEKFYSLCLLATIIFSFLALIGLFSVNATDSPIVFTNSDVSTSVGSGIYLFQDFNVSVSGAYVSNIQAYSLTDHDTEEWYMTLHPVNSTGYPNMAVVLGTSNTVNKLHANPSWNLESFTFSPHIWLNGSTYYAFVWHSTTWQIYRRVAASSGILGDTSGKWNSSVSDNAVTWSSYDGNDIYFIITGSVGPEPTPTPTATPTPSYLTYQYNVIDPSNGSAATWNANDDPLVGGPQFNLLQGVNYTYAGNLLNNSSPFINGTYYLWATERANGTADAALYGSPTNMSFANTHLFNDELTLIKTGSIINGFVLFYLAPDYVYNSTYTYQAFKFNATVVGSSEVWENTFMIKAQEPEFFFSGTLTGGHFGNIPTSIAEAPTIVVLQQRSVYTFTGETWVNNIINGTGNFTTYSTGLGSATSIFTTGTYSQVVNSNFTDGTFTFNLASRQAQTDVYEGYRITATLDDGKTYSKTYYFRWAVNVWGPTPTPGGQMGQGGNLDTTTINNNLNMFITFFLLFIVIGGPMLVLGGAAGVPGLIVGGSFGIGLATLAGWLPSYLVLFFGVAVVAAFLMWRNQGPS